MSDSKCLYNIIYLCNVIMSDSDDVTISESIIIVFVFILNMPCVVTFRENPNETVYYIMSNLWEA